MCCPGNLWFVCGVLHNRLKVYFAIQRHTVSKIHVTLSNLHVLGYYSEWHTFVLHFTTKAVLVPSSITKILSEIEQIPLQFSHKNTKYVVKTWISISWIPTVNRTFHRLLKLIPSCIHAFNNYRTDWKNLVTWKVSTSRVLSHPNLVPRFSLLPLSLRMDG